MNEFILRLTVSVAAVILIDVLLYFGLRRLFVSKGWRGNGGRKFTWIYWSITAVFALYALLHYLYLHFYGYGPAAYRQYFFITGAFLLIYLPKVLMLAFVIAGQVLILFLQLLSFLFQNRGHYEFVRKTRRIKILSWTGFLAGMAFFAFIIYGMTVTRTDYKVKEVTLRYRNLPAAFNGTRILLVSDIHTGSFFNENELGPAFRKMRELSPDMLVFAGDMINVSATEAEPYISFFREIDPPLGKYAVMGNHDQDDYMKLTRTESREVIEKSLMQAEYEMGFTLLRNDHRFVHKGKDSIAVIGVDNWGKAPFHQYGELKPAMKGVPNACFKILLSHNPNHWEFEIRGKSNIDLTLSGHTHALQIGIDEPWCHWSPIRYKYPYYMGLYQWGSQYLYVNVGLGYLGFPGRIGIPPEITLITLQRS